MIPSATYEKNTRGFTSDPNGLARILVEAIQHPGFAFVQALSPCAQGASRSAGSWLLRRALSPARSPRVPPLTMLGADGALRKRRGGANIVKNGTPQKALERHPARGAVVGLHFALAN